MGSTTRTDAAVVPPVVSDWIAERLARRQFELPLLPAAVTRVMDLASRPDTDAAELSDVLHGDQAFAGHVLRIANSPAMGSSVPIISLQQAVSRLGMGRIAEIALAISVQGKLFQAAGHTSLLRALWRHSLATANFAKEIARARRANVESAFLCGLLHAIGKPLILDSLGELERQNDSSLADPVVCAVMDAHHREVGVLLCEEWGLPDQVTEAVHYQSSYLEAPNHQVHAMVVQLASWLAHHAVPAVVEAAKAVEVAAEFIRELPVVEELNFYPDDMDALFGRTEAVVQMVEAIS